MQSNSEKSPLGIQFNNSILHLWYSAPLSFWFSECYYSEWKWMASTSEYARMQLSSIYHIWISWISAAARQNVIFNAIPISTLKKLFVRQSGWRCSFPYARQIYSTPPDSIQAAIILFCTTVQTPRCDGWGGVRVEGWEKAAASVCKVTQWSIRDSCWERPFDGATGGCSLWQTRRLVVYRTNTADTNPAINHV